MPRRILIVGCGYVGLAAGAELVCQGHQVWGLRRSRKANAQLESAGIEPLNADVTVAASLPVQKKRFDWVIHCLSASGGGPAEYRQTYVEGTRCVLNWLAAVPPERLVYTSSTSVYGQTDGSLVDETSATAPRTQTGVVLLEAEQVLWREARVGACVLRVGAIYGPGRSYWLDRLLAGEARLDGQGTRLLNMIHRDDVAGAICAALNRGEPGRIYNAVDDEPVRQLDLLDWLCRRLGRALPAPSSADDTGPRKRGLTSKRVSNRRLHEELGYRFKFPSFKDGLEQILADRDRDMSQR